MSVQDTNLYLNGLIDNFDIENKKIHIDGEWHEYDIIINTISMIYYLILPTASFLLLEEIIIN